jgi:hypothetical protein
MRGTIAACLPPAVARLVTTEAVLTGDGRKCAKGVSAVHRNDAPPDISEANAKRKI